MRLTRNPAGEALVHYHPETPHVAPRHRRPAARPAARRGVTGGAAALRGGCGVRWAEAEQRQQAVAGDLCVEPAGMCD